MIAVFQALRCWELCCKFGHWVEVMLLWSPHRTIRVVIQYMNTRKFHWLPDVPEGECGRRVVLRVGTKGREKF